MSSGGKVAKAFADVIKALWSERKTAFRPQALKVCTMITVHGSDIAQSPLSLIYPFHLSQTSS